MGQIDTEGTMIRGYPGWMLKNGFEVYGRATAFDSYCIGRILYSGVNWYITDNERGWWFWSLDGRETMFPKVL